MQILSHPFGSRFFFNGFFFILFFFMHLFKALLTHLPFIFRRFIYMAPNTLHVCSLDPVWLSGKAIPPPTEKPGSVLAP